MSRWVVISNNWSGIKDQFRDVVDDVIGTAALMCEDHAKQDPPIGAPVDTGTLAGSISSEHVVGSLESICSVSAEYAGYVNYGTVYQEANPFFDRAVVVATEYATKELAEIGGKLD